VCDLAGRIEPFARAEVAPREEQRHVDELFDLQRRAAAPPVRLREHGQDVERAQQAPAEPRIARRHEREVHVSVLEARGQTNPAVLDEMHLDAGVPPPIARQEAGEQSLHRLRCGAYPEQPRVPTPEGLRPFAEGVSVCQQASAPPQQILALGRQQSAAADAVEERHAQMGLQGVDLPRERRLAEIQ